MADDECRFRQCHTVIVLGGLEAFYLFMEDLYSLGVITFIQLARGKAPRSLISSNIKIRYSTP